jgi:hypothetical protein
MKNKTARTVSNGEAEPNAMPENNTTISTRERQKMLACIWSRVGNVSVPLFMEILANAANAMLDDIENSASYGNVHVSRSALFKSTGELTETGRCYVRLEFKKMLPGEFRGRKCSYELIEDLALVLDAKLFGFFENDRVMKTRLEQKGQAVPI